MYKLHLWKKPISQSSCLYNTLHKRWLSWALPLGQSTAVSIITYGNTFWPISIEFYSWLHLLESYALLALMHLFLLDIFYASYPCFVWGYSCPNIMFLYGDFLWNLCRVMFWSLGQVVLLSGSWAIYSEKMFYKYYLGGFSGELIKLIGSWALPLPSIACQPLSAIVC